MLCLGLERPFSVGINDVSIVDSTHPVAIMTEGQENFPPQSY